MAKGDIITKRRHRARARRIIKQLLENENFRIKKIIKFGSRYFIAVGKKDGRRALFKTCIYPRSYDHLTNQKFSREILFLQYINGSSLQYLNKTAPSILSSSIDIRAWYIREYITGRTQNVSGGNIRFRRNFFGTKSRNWVLGILRELHSIKQDDLPYNFKKLLYAPQTLGYLWQFIEPSLPKVETFIKWPGAGKLIHKEFIRYGPIYRNKTRVLAHQELYAPHILEEQTWFRIIDWENVGWASIMKDVVTIWMRASKEPRWQRQLYLDFRQQYRTLKNFDELWDATVFVQSTFNVIGYFFYPDKRDFKELARFSGTILNSMLADKYSKET